MRRKILETRNCQLWHAFINGRSIREAMRAACVAKETAHRRYRVWRGGHAIEPLLTEAMLQLAYDYLWDGDGEACDAVTAFLPEEPVKHMLDAWCNDWCGDEPKSKWH